MRSFAAGVTALGAFVDEQVSERRKEIRAELASGDHKRGKKDVFSMLVKANELEGNGKLQLNDSELVRILLSDFMCRPSIPP
jgi:hypothetical protein